MDDPKIKLLEHNLTHLPFTASPKPYLNLVPNAASPVIGGRILEATSNYTHVWIHTVPPALV
jgi:hypothetical protein